MKLYFPPAGQLEHSVCREAGREEVTHVSIADSQRGPA